MNQPNLMDVDWSKIPAPIDDGATKHLIGLKVPPVVLPATDGAPLTKTTNGLVEIDRPQRCFWAAFGFGVLTGSVAP